MALVKYNGKNVYSCNFTTRLMPGINEIPEGELKALLLHPLFKWRVSEGVIVIVASSDKDVEEKKSVKEMTKLIPQIFDHAYLKRIVETDGREKIVAEAKKQLHKISHQAEDEEKNEHFRSDTKSSDS